MMHDQFETSLTPSRNNYLQKSGKWSNLLHTLNAMSKNFLEPWKGLLLVKPRSICPFRRTSTNRA
jgi:hypothetical protein